MEGVFVSLQIETTSTARGRLCSDRSGGKEKTNESILWTMRRINGKEWRKADDTGKVWDGSEINGLLPLLVGAEDYRGPWGVSYHMH